MPETHESNSDMLTGRNAVVIVNLEEPLTSAEIEMLSKKHRNLRIVQPSTTFGELVEEVKKVRGKRRQNRTFKRKLALLMDQLRAAILQPKPGEVIVVYDQVNGGMIVPRICMELELSVHGINRSDLVEEHS